MVHSVHVPGYFLLFIQCVLLQRAGKSLAESSNNPTSKQSIRSQGSVDTDTRTAVLNFVGVSGDPPDHTLIRPSQLRVRSDRFTTHDGDVHRPAARNSQSFSGHHHSADNARTRTTVTGRPYTEDAVDATGNGRSVSKSGAMSENRRREQSDVLRRQTTVQNGSLWPINHKEVR